MDLKNIENIGFYKEYRKLIGTYQFNGQPSSIGIILPIVTVNVYSESNGEYMAEPDIYIRRKDDGHPESANGWGKTEEEAIFNSLSEIVALLKKHYPNDLPEQAIINKVIEDNRENTQLNKKFKRYDYQTENWRGDKLHRNRKCGPYIEFQLETDGCYAHWKEDSIYVGNSVFDPLYKAFCINDRKFNTWGHNLFTVHDLPILIKNLENQIDTLKAVSSISDYVENVAPIYPWIFEPEKPIWIELKDANIEFIEAIIALSKQGFEENRALYALGI